MKLIIVESPAKARTITNFLGRGYKVIASKGHIRDLPKSRFGITVDEETKELIPKYAVAKENTATVKEIRDLAKKSDEIYIATDEDREGEAIGWHIAHAIKKDPEELPRIVFHEITKTAITDALKHARKIDMNMVNAQQARRLLDRVVGYKLSPLMASKIQKGLSAGRVQSSALKLIVDREREIKAFVPQEYWDINTLFKTDIEATLIEHNGEKLSKLSIENKDRANKIAQSVKNDKFVIDAIETKERKSKTPPPFMTSTLQQTASSKLGFTPKKTMMVAQSLYEGVNTPDGTSGVITYMRTDSLNLAKEAVSAVRDEIESRFGSKYLPKSPKVYTKKAKGAQEAHEAIRPTMLSFTPKIAAQYLKGDEIKLYTLIYERFMACQMEDAVFEQQSILFKGDENIYRASGRKLVFDGFYKLTGNEDKDKLLPALKEGEDAQIQSVKPEQHFTELPSRYSEAALIKKLESEGIGRPSTYAPTIATLSNRTYVSIEKKQIVPTDMAFTVTEILEKNFGNIVDVSFTANMEEKLDEIAEGNTDWQKLLSDFYFPFEKQIEEGKKNIISLKMAKPLGRNCPKCGEELLLRSGRFGQFVACSGFPKCKYTEQVDEDGNKVEKQEEIAEDKCDKCGKDMVVKSGRNGQFLACSGYPECKNTKSISVEEKTSDTPCPECGCKISLKNSRRGAFWGCENYPKCKFISKFEPTTIKCREDGCDGVLAARVYRNKDVYECVKCKKRTPKEEIDK
ncbi:MAG: type I DNA topoisomerase [Campylobacterales bacterium]|nr:type I DNA topoisomerase [Campylobacterales bacterium]